MVKEKLKIIIMIIVIVIISLVIINFVESSNSGKVSGKLEIWVPSRYYNYIETVTKGFEEKHKDVIIDVKKIDNNNYYADVISSIKDKDEPDIAILNSAELYDMVNKEKIYPVDLGGTVSTYSMNFSTNRLEQVHFDQKYYGVPFTSSPLVLYARNDMLNKYGFNNTDINTWQDVYNIGQKIFKDSNGTVRLLSGVGEDYTNLKELILLENMQDGLTEQEILNRTNEMLNSLQKDNIIAMKKGEEYAAKIGSVDSMREISAIKENCEWTANNPPSLVVGSNKFYEGLGENLVALKQDNKNLSSDFIAYLSNDTKLSLEYTLSGNVFSSYLYTYKNTGIEEKVNNFEGKMPLVVMSNIEEKVPLMKNYQLYMKLRSEIINN